MTVGLCGSHRTGKTTLAKAFVERNPGYTFVETRVSGSFARLGFDPKVDYDFKTRLLIQNAILDDMIQQFNAAGMLFVADRTPVDLIAYTMADVSRETLDAETSAALEAYVQRCVEATNRFFAMLLVVQPGIEPVAAEGKGPPLPGYMEHLNMLVLGALMSLPIKCSHFAINRETLDLERRLAVMSNMISFCRNRVATAENIAVLH